MSQEVLDHTRHLMRVERVDKPAGMTLMASGCCRPWRPITALPSLDIGNRRQFMLKPAALLDRVETLGTVQPVFLDNLRRSGSRYSRGRGRVAGPDRPPGRSPSRRGSASRNRAAEPRRLRVNGHCDGETGRLRYDGLTNARRHAGPRPSRVKKQAHQEHLTDFLLGKQRVQRILASTFPRTEQTLPCQPLAGSTSIYPSTNKTFHTIQSACAITCDCRIVI